LGWLGSNFTISRPDRSVDPDGTGLRFTDVLFGFVFKEVFFRLADWNDIPGPNADVVRMHLVLTAAVTMGSYIGFRNSLKRQSYGIRFFNLPIVKFSLDQAMVVLYFVLATRTPDKIDGFLSTTETYDASWAQTSIAVVFWIFVLYVAWDIASWWMTKRDYPLIQFTSAGLVVTVGGLALVGACCLVAGTVDTANAAAVVLGATTGATLLYRFAKDHRQPPVATEQADDPLVEDIAACDT
jgi:hypothetical protein